MPRTARLDIVEDRAVRLKREGWNIERIAIRCYELMGVEIDDIKTRSRVTALSEARSLQTFTGTGGRFAPESTTPLGNYRMVTSGG